MPGNERGRRGGHAAGLALAPLIAMIILAGLPLASAGAAPTKVYSHPFAGAQATATVNTTTLGCARASLVVPPFLNGTRGVGGFSIRASAWGCLNSSILVNDSASFVAVKLVDRVPVNLPGGQHSVNVTWNLTAHAWAKVVHYPTAPLSRICKRF